MCGRYSLHATKEQLMRVFDVTQVPPTQTVGAIRLEPEGRTLGQMRWGLIPAWTAPNPRARNVGCGYSERSAVVPLWCLGALTWSVNVCMTVNGPVPVLESVTEIVNVYFPFGAVVVPLISPSLDSDSPAGSAPPTSANV
jgi:hypothetical protein